MIWLTPPLVTPYVNTFESGGPEDTDEMLMIEPPRPASTIAFPNTWQPRKTLRRLTSMMRCHSASSISKNGVAELMPAAFSRMSTRPKASSVA